MFRPLPATASSPADRRSGRCADVGDLNFDNTDAISVSFPNPDDLMKFNGAPWRLLPPPAHLPVLVSLHDSIPTDSVLECPSVRFHL